MKEEKELNFGQCVFYQQQELFELFFRLGPCAQQAAPQAKAYCTATESAVSSR